MPSRLVVKECERAKPKVVGEKPNCDAGFKIDASGKSCVKIARERGPGKEGEEVRKPAQPQLGRFS